MSSVVRRYSIEDRYPFLKELAGGIKMLEMINFVFPISALCDEVLQVCIR